MIRLMIVVIGDGFFDQMIEMMCADNYERRSAIKIYRLNKRLTATV